MIRCTTEHQNEVERVLMDGDVFPFIIDDIYCGYHQIHETLSDPDIYVLMPNSEACFLFLPMVSVTYDSHVAVLPKSRGPQAVESGKQAIEWMWDNSPARKIVANVPENRDDVVRYVLRVGFKKEGTMTEAFLKDGKLRDLIMFGINKEG